MNRVHVAAFGTLLSAFCIPSYISTGTSLAADPAGGAGGAAGVTAALCTPPRLVIRQRCRSQSSSGRHLRGYSPASAISIVPSIRHSPEAQAYFDQGMRFLWAFNHDEATRSFAKAAMLDPGCASCYWGVALTIGPNYNLPMMAEPRGRVAWDALQQAQRHAASATPVESFTDRRAGQALSERGRAGASGLGVTAHRLC